MVKPCARSIRYFVSTNELSLAGMEPRGFLNKSSDSLPTNYGVHLFHDLMDMCGMTQPEYRNT